MARFASKLDCDVRSTDHVRVDAACAQLVVQSAVGLLAGAEDDVVDSEDVLLAVHLVMQAVVVDPVVGRTGDPSALASRL
jgi:hypothetical protein